MIRGKPKKKNEQRFCSDACVFLTYFRYEPFLLNPSVCVLLYVLSLAVTCVSSCVLYMYGHHKLAAFLERASDRHHIR